MMFLDLSTFERSASVGDLQRRATKNIVSSFGLVTVVSILPMCTCFVYDPKNDKLIFIICPHAHIRLTTHQTQMK